MNILPPITPKQQTILHLIYTHRFLNTKHIQTFLNHKDKRRSTIWLKDLTEKGYLVRIYDPTDFIAKSRPAIYYISLNGIRFLRNLNDDNYPPESLRKRYKESTRSESYKNRCMLLAECCIDLESKTKGSTSYEYCLEADYTNPGSDYIFLAGKEDGLKPSLYFHKQQTKKTEAVYTHYILELFDSTTPRYSLRNKLNDYVSYIDEQQWQIDTDTEDFPVILLAFQTIADMLYAKRRVKLLFEREAVADELQEDIRFTTYEKIRELGVTGLIWEEL
jgi:hypothetical protein